jgi:molybdenum cofactor synthesis domain-containing protein
MGLLPAGPVPLGDGIGLVLAEDVVAAHPVPPFANSGMDGYAVRSEDVTTVPVELVVLEDVPAGTVPTEAVGPGTAVKIMTGAPFPQGADAVVIVEDSEPVGTHRVVLRASATPGQHVRPAGGDLPAGAVVATAGTRLSPRHIGMLATVGVAEPVVTRRPVVAVASTGDELVPVDGRGLRPGAIFDSNRPMLVGLLREFGADVLDLGIVPDDARLLRSALGEAAAAADAVVTSGGVSMGEYDLVKSVLSDLGSVGFWQVAMQPAKPFAFGFLGETPFFGLRRIRAVPAPGLAAADGGGRAVQAPGCRRPGRAAGHESREDGVRAGPGGTRRRHGDGRSLRRTGLQRAQCARGRRRLRRGAAGGGRPRGG